MHAIGLFPAVTHPDRGEYRTVRAPMRIRDVDTTPTAPAPLAGEHSRAVLAEAGFDAETIDRLLAEGSVAATDDGAGDPGR